MPILLRRKFYPLVAAFVCATAGCSVNSLAQPDTSTDSSTQSTYNSAVDNSVPDSSNSNTSGLPQPVRQVTEYYGNATPQTDSSAFENLPADWQQSYFKEPLWGSRLFVLQAGLQHKQSVLLVHGLGSRGIGDWLDVIPTLAREYHVIAFDLPGFARSEKPVGKYSPENYAKIVAWLVQELAHGPVRAVGYSMGAAITLEYAASYPQQIERVVLVSAAGIVERRALMENAVELPIETGWLPGPLEKLGNKVGQLGRRFVEWTSVVPDPSSVIDDYDPIWLTLFSDYPFANAAYALSMHNFYDAIDLLQKDTYLIWGSDDGTAPLRTGKILNAKLTNADLQIISGAGHTLMTTHPRAFQQHLVNALHSEKLDSSSANTIPLPFRGEIDCHDEHGKTFSGRYDTIAINNCTGILLQDVEAKSIEISNSQVEMENVRVSNENDSALHIFNSFVKATNSNYSGTPAVFSNASRLDFANVTLSSPKYAMRFEKKSRVVFSLSQMQSKVYSGPLHGLHSGQYLWLDDKL